jgi:hypothetical protein
MSRTTRTHIRGYWGYPTKRYRPACGAVGNRHSYSDAPTCKRCRRAAAALDLLFASRTDGRLRE